MTWELLTTSGCSQGVRARAWLDEHQVSCEIVLLDQDVKRAQQEHGEQRRWLEQENAPLQTPALKRDGVFVGIGYQPDVWERFLEEQV